MTAPPPDPHPPADPAGLPDPYEVVPLAAPPDATVPVPGSKSVTNRALVAAALAAGRTRLVGILRADDTEAMLGGLIRLGVGVEVDSPTATVVDVSGCGGRPRPGAPVTVDAHLSGTTSRFLLPVAALADADVTVDGGPPLRRRPMGDLVGALRQLGVELVDDDDPGHLPVRIRGRGSLDGGTVAVPGDASSQFLSGLLLAGPCTRRGLEVRLTTDLVSRPYVDMTVAVATAFGAEVGWVEPDRLRAAPTGYRTPVGPYRVEPDASAASYLFAAAALTGGRVTVPDLGPASLQGDRAFVDVLADMGAEVSDGPDGTTVRGTGRLTGTAVDLADLSDTAQTLAAVAVFADGPTTITGIGFIRGKETDRIGAVVTELRRCGIDAEELDDGLRVHPGTPRPTVVQTYDDHRMAMAFALLGLRAPGIRIADPGCVAKTFPGYFAALDRLR